MARPKPPAPSSRVVIAFFVAGIIGGLIFLILWVTGRHGTSGTEAPGLRTDPAVRQDKPAAASEAAPRGGVLRGAIDPDAVAETLERLTQATLVRVNRSTDQLEPWLAESWTTTGATYLLKLRPNVVWSDGGAFTAADVAYTIGASPLARVMGKPLTATAKGPLEVAVTFPGPFAPGLRLLDRVPMVFRDKPDVGLGPFVLVPAPKGSGVRTVVLERNARYWRTAPDGKALPYLDRVELDAAADRNSHATRLVNGELDFIEAELRPEDYTALKRADQDDRARLYDMGPNLGADVLWLNRTGGASGPALRAYFSKDDFRLAISAAVNRRAFCDAVYLGACDPVFGPVTPGSAAWFLADLPAAGPDPARARTMLAGLGLHDLNGDGVLDDESGGAIRFTALVSRSSPSAERGAAFIRDQLKNVGIRMDVTAVDSAVIVDRRRKGTYDAIFGRLESPDSDPAMSLDYWLPPNAATDWERRISDLMLKQATTSDRVERVQLFADVQKIQAQHMPEIYFGAPYRYVTTNLHVLNVKPSRQRPALLWNGDQLAVTAR